MIEILVDVGIAAAAAGLGAGAVLLARGKKLPRFRLERPAPVEAPPMVKCQVTEYTYADGVIKEMHSVCDGVSTDAQAQELHGATLVSARGAGSHEIES